MMLDKLKAIEDRFDEVGQLIVQPDATADIKKYSKLSKEYKDLQKIVDKLHEYQKVLDHIDSAKSVLSSEKDPDFREMAKAELDELQPRKEQLEGVLKTMLIPKDPNDGKNSVLEIRAGTGGDEAAIFAGDLFRMYQRFAEKSGWRVEVLDLTEGTSGGYKEIISMVTGDDVYGKLKYESGVHRVVR